MSFGPVNAPGFYSCIMGTFKKEWDGLLLEIMESYALSGEKDDDNTVEMSNGHIHLDSDRLYSGTKSIIDNILI